MSQKHESDLIEWKSMAYNNKNHKHDTCKFNNFIYIVQ